MKVSELIEFLKKQDQDAIVILDTEYSHDPITVDDIEIDRKKVVIVV